MTLRPMSSSDGETSDSRPSFAFTAPLRPEAESLEGSLIQEVWEAGFGRENLIGLWVGEGDLPTPGFICEAAIASLRAGNTFYTPKRGLPELRDSLASYHNRLLGTALSAEDVTVTASGMSSVMLCMQTLIRPGDRVAIISPIWPNVVQAVKIAGGQPVEVGLDAKPEGGFALNLQKLARILDNERPRALFIATPGNPTGWMMESDEMQQVLSLCREYGIWLLADEVYHRFTYDRPVAPSFLSLARADDPVIAIHSFSKAWAMTGWRIGWLVHPAELGDIFGRLIEYSTSGGQTFLQAGALTAINDGEDFVAEMVQRCREGGEIVYQALSELERVRIAQPQAAFYSFFAIDGMHDSLAFCKELLEETGVGLAPGAAFGSSGEGFVRLCFASSPARISEAMDRIKPLLK
ncbi:pyridoxal phosphate-dependent aminotransferase [Fodinicurvata sediminis]|uniref:pyridoxal phosphate-dependent aminotransferase n=1 Tax=Fodinicurvata sediminis TaxID=1121832 RepID=UPI0003B50B10|nr:pyridoxal phosphate-dependent aminotransferase [Fodinicurvata sediminis]